MLQAMPLERALPIFRVVHEDSDVGLGLRSMVNQVADAASLFACRVQIQIDDTGKNPNVNPPTFGDPLHVTGSVYTLAPATKVASRPLGQWNASEIQAKGNDVTVTLNGQLVTTLKNGNRPKQGYIGLQNHHFGSRVQFRNIRIQPL